MKKDIMIKKILFLLSINSLLTNEPKFFTFDTKHHRTEFIRALCAQNKDDMEKQTSIIKSLEEVEKQITIKKAEKVSLEEAIQKAADAISDIKISFSTGNNPNNN